MYKLDSGGACQFNLVTPLVGNRQIRISTQYNYPVLANRLDCAPGASQCDSNDVDSEYIYIYSGNDNGQYTTTYFFSNLDLQQQQFAFSSSVSTLISAALSLTSQALIATVIVGVALLF